MLVSNVALPNTGSCSRSVVKEHVILITRLLSDNDVLDSLKHSKIYPNVDVAHPFTIGQNIYLPLSSVSGSNVSLYVFEALAKSRTQESRRTSNAS